ncbi:MAG: amidohydrolase family protein [Candidatus Bathyarchaeia archaeon]
MEIIIRNGGVVDGTGNPWFKADVGIEGGRIEKIGDLRGVKADEVIDARGLIVCPGFIDMHSHSDLALLKDPLSEQKVRQGITTELLGQDGFSVAPVRAETVGKLKTYLAGLLGELDREWSWRTLGEYFETLERSGTATNVASYVGHATVRVASMGFDDRAPTGEEMDGMRELLAQAMLEGAMGMSSGLVYPPSCYATTDELVELCRVVARYGGIYTSHIRGESYTLETSLQEAITIGRRAGIPVHISHHKASGRDNWGKVKKTLSMIDQARTEGLDITCDQYPYTAGSTMLGVIIPPWAHEGGVESLVKRLKDPETREKLRVDMSEGVPGWSSYLRAAGWENILITYCRKNKGLEGKTLAEIAREEGRDPFDTAFDLLIEENAAVSIVLFYLSEGDVRTVMRHPAVMVGTDGLLGGKPHPRVYGTYPRILGRYVREEGVLTLEDAVRKMTSLPAQRLGLWDRGLIREGFSADITTFDPKGIIDRGTYVEPRQFPEGIEHVIINGVIVLEGGRQREVYPGRVLRKRLGDRV